MCKQQIAMDYFKGEKEFFEFCLLCIDGKNRMDLLGATIKCYSSKKYAKTWYENILNKIENEAAIEKLNELYDFMVG